MRAPIVAACLALCLVASAANILTNPSFEAGSGQNAAGWGTDIRQGQYEFLIADGAHTGDRCLGIRSKDGDAAGWARWFTTDLYLMQGATYRASIWVRAEGGATAMLWIPSDGKGVQKSLTEVAEWTLIEADFEVAHTGRHGIYLQIHGPGAAYFDDVSVETLQPAPATPGEPVPTDGKPIGGIVLPDSTGPHHGYLGLELQRILEAMTGKKPGLLSQSAATAKADQRLIWVDVLPPGRNYAPQLRRVGEEGIVLDIGPDAIVCLGNTPRGVYYAVHEFLHILGCTWAWPGPLGEVLPQAESLSLQPRLIVHQPSFELRGGHIIQVHHTPPDWTPKHVNSEHWVDWAARNRMNRLKPSYPDMWGYGAIRGGEWREFAGHTLHTVLPPEKHFAAHPEYYPLVNGKRTHLHSSGRAAEVCVANPEVARAVADFIINYFDTHPEAKRFGVNAEDEPSYWCECEACKALDTEELDWTQNGIDCMHLTDRWLTFINRVAEMVEEKYPDKTIFTFAYGSSRELPRKAFPRRNVMIELTWWDQCFKHAMTDPACEINAKGMERFQGWSRLADLSLYRYLDYHHLECPGAYCAAEASILRAAHAGGCRQLSDEWDTTFSAAPLLLNLRARLEWDVNTDVEAFIDDFCARVYGKAGETVAEYFRRLEEATLEAPGEHVSFNNLEKFTPEVLRDCGRLLDVAAKEADDDDVLARIDRLRYSLLFAELDVVTEKIPADAALYGRQAEIQAQLRELVHRRKIEPILGYYGRFSTEYQPPVAALQGRKVLRMPDEWQFRTDPDDQGEAQGWQKGAPDGEWRPISILKAWEEQGFGGYDGHAWYTVEVDVPEIAAKRVWLLCEAVDETFELWINGEYAGASEGDGGLLWDKPVAVDITGKFAPGKATRFTMKVHDSAFAGGIWKPVWIVAEE